PLPPAPAYLSPTHGPPADPQAPAQGLRVLAPRLAAWVRAHFSIRQGHLGLDREVRPAGLAMDRGGDGACLDGLDRRWAQGVGGGAARSPPANAHTLCSSRR